MERGRMAKLQPVKCFYCGQTFDRDKVEFVSVSARRYAHKKCADIADEIHAIVKKELGDFYSRTKVNRNILDFSSKEGHSLEEILGATKYWFYEKNKNKSVDASKSGGGLGILPYIFPEYLQQKSKKEKNKKINAGKNIEDFVHEGKEIEYKIPPIRKPRGLNFFDLK